MLILTFSVESKSYVGWAKKTAHPTCNTLILLSTESIRIIVFHFHLYLYLTQFLRNYKAQVQPEFPTGNGSIDLLIRYAGQLFGLELKIFADQQQYREALKQAAKYGKQLGLTSIWLVLFIEAVDDKNRQRFEVSYTDKKRGVTVHPLFVQTGKA